MKNTIIVKRKNMNKAKLKMFLLLVAVMSTEKAHAMFDEREIAKASRRSLKTANEESAIRDLQNESRRENINILLAIIQELL